MTDEKEPKVLAWVIYSGERMTLWYHSRVKRDYHFMEQEPQPIYDEEDIKEFEDNPDSFVVVHSTQRPAKSFAELKNELGTDKKKKK